MSNLYETLSMLVFALVGWAVVTASRRQQASVDLEAQKLRQEHEVRMKKLEIEHLALETERLKLLDRPVREAKGLSWDSVVETTTAPTTGSVNVGSSAVLLPDDPKDPRFAEELLRLRKDGDR